MYLAFAPTCDLQSETTQKFVIDDSLDVDHPPHYSSLLHLLRQSIRKRYRSPGDGRDPGVGLSSGTNIYH